MRTLLLLMLLTQTAYAPPAHLHQRTPWRPWYCWSGEAEIKIPLSYCKDAFGSYRTYKEIG